MRTENVDLMELFGRLFDAGSDEVCEPLDSTLMPPMTELGASPVCMDDILSEDGSLVTDKLSNFVTLTRPELSKEVSELAVLIANAEDGFQKDDERGKRLLDFVYPVV